LLRWLQDREISSALIPCNRPFITRLVIKIGKVLRNLISANLAQSRMTPAWRFVLVNQERTDALREIMTSQKATRQNQVETKDLLERAMKAIVKITMTDKRCGW
jgi:hypothetical protein